MKIVDKAEAIEWLSSRGLVDANGTLLPQSFTRQALYLIPPDSGKKTVIGKVLALTFTEFDESMLFIDEFGIWPSAENWYLFDMFRRSLGETKHLFESPGHIFGASDKDAVFALVSLVLYFI